MKSGSKNRKMSIRISQKDLDRIHALADRSGQSLTDYVTACCLRKKIIVVEGVEEAFRQLKAIGNNLNQLTALCHMKRIQCADLKEFTEEAAVVKLIFDKYTAEGYGAQRIASHLNGLGYRARTGKMWHHASIRGIITNLTYTGVLRSGESRSPLIPELQIISPEQFQRAQEIRTDRANNAEETRAVPLNTRGQSLLSGNVFCAHCGSRLNLTTNGKYIQNADGIIDKLIHEVFQKVKGIPRGESAFPKEMLAELIDKGEKECVQLEEARHAARDALSNGQELMGVLETQYEKLVSWADMYDTANIATKKMIVNQLIHRVDVGRGYELNVEFTIDYQQFMLGLDVCKTA